MKKNGLVFFKLVLSTFILFTGCKDEVVPTPPDPRDKLTGIFQMTKLENGDTYTMKVEKQGTLCTNCDSLKYTNYADLFDFTLKRIVTDVDSQLSIGIVNPALDKFGYKWKLSSNGIPYPPTNYNVIFGDSIKIRFKLSNMLYYQADGVPMVLDTILTHVGIKIADVE